jgi:hypothetical protein
LYAVAVVGLDPAVGDRDPSAVSRRIVEDAVTAVSMDRRVVDDAGAKR